MICLYVAKDNHCMLASLAHYGEYEELSLILHDMREGSIYGQNFFQEL